MLSLTWLSTTLGIDSFVASFALGPLVGGRKRYAIAGAFGACDAAAYVLGPLLGSPLATAFFPQQDRALSLAMIGCGLYLWMVARQARAPTLGWPGWLVIPIAASLDNLIAGALASGSAPIGLAAAETGAASAAMSLAGFASSAMLRRSSLCSRRLAAAAWPIGAALVLLIA